MRYKCFILFEQQNSCLCNWCRWLFIIEHTLKINGSVQTVSNVVVYIIKLRKLKAKSNLRNWFLERVGEMIQFFQTIWTRGMGDHQSSRLPHLKTCLIFKTVTSRKLLTRIIVWNDGLILSTYSHTSATYAQMMNMYYRYFCNISKTRTSSVWPRLPPSRWPTMLIITGGARTSFLPWNVTVSIRSKTFVRIINWIPPSPLPWYFGTVFLQHCRHLENELKQSYSNLAS